MEAGHPEIRQLERPNGASTAKAVDLVGSDPSLPSGCLDLAEPRPDLLAHSFVRRIEESAVARHAA